MEQLELFSQVKDYNDKKISVSKSFLNYIWNYEKTILTIICFIITGIISFSLGIEKGKQLALSRIRPKSEIVDRLESTPKTMPQNVIPNQGIVNKPQELKTPKVRNYSIQLVTYQNKTQAQKEAEILRKKGFASLILYKSGYNVVCVGNFHNREKAQALLSEFKKRYPDCFIRRL